MFVSSTDSRYVILYGERGVGVIVEPQYGRVGGSGIGVTRVSFVIGYWVTKGTIFVQNSYDRLFLPLYLLLKK